MSKRREAIETPDLSRSYNLIIAKGLTKVFHKKHLGLRLSSRKSKGQATNGKEPVVAVDKVDLEISRGVVFGLLGPNGAGKTTLIKLLSTLVIPTSGTATVNGYDIRTQEREVRASIGLGLGGERSFYWRLTGRQNIEFFGTMQGLTGRRLKKQVSEVLDRLDLSDVQDVPFMEYSLGMKRKLDIARALLTDSPIFLFDELTSSIDPYAALKIRELVQDLKEQGKTILLVTHNLVEAEQLCDLIGIMNHGKLIAVGDASSLRGLVKGCKIRIRPDGRGLELLHILSRLEGLENVRREGSEIVILASRRDGVVNQIIKAIATTEVPVQGINVDRPSLEDVFLHLTGSNNAPNSRLR